MGSVLCGITIIAFTLVKGYNGYVVFSWVYGFFLGGYNYALKIYTYERVRARHFPRAWSFVQWSQAIPVLMGTPLISMCK
jgi:O-antigen/teichoic acid export membrane protein